MDLQQMFDTVATHLLRQRKKSKKPGDSGMCMYRGPGGLKCAAGVLLDDKDYSSNMEGVWVGGPAVSWALPVGRRENLKLLSALQNMHDQEPVSDWVSGLGDIAFEYGLSDFAIRNSVRFM